LGGKMSYKEIWDLLADLLIELRNRGSDVPYEMLKDLRSAKTMMNILKADPGNNEIFSRMELYLGKVESNLIIRAQEKLGLEYTNQWLKKLDSARRKIHQKREKKNEALRRFVIGLPPGVHWVRIRVSEETPRDLLEKLVKEEGLLFRRQENGYTLIYGNGERVKYLIKRLRESVR
jgi:hypothetical protein